MTNLIRIEATFIDCDQFLRGPKLEVSIYIGKDRFTYIKGLPYPLTDSYFDLIWQDMGDKFKRAIKEKNNENTKEKI